MFEINNYKKRLFVLDNFYKNPDEIRDFALNQEYHEDIRFYKGLRSTKSFIAPGTKEIFESIIGEKILDFNSGANGVFQITSAENPQVYHCDAQKWAGMIYLSPHAPVISGTRTHISKSTGARDSQTELINHSFPTGFYDSTQFEVVDSIGNIYNRLVIFNGHMIHSAGPYFGTNMWNGRLIHLFFFS